MKLKYFLLFSKSFGPRVLGRVVMPKKLKKCQNYCALMGSSLAYLEHHQPCGLLYHWISSFLLLVLLLHLLVLQLHLVLLLFLSHNLRLLFFFLLLNSFNNDLLLFMLTIYEERQVAQRQLINTGGE
jgi:hypothetical protein